MNGASGGVSGGTGSSLNSSAANVSAATKSALDHATATGTTTTTTSSPSNNNDFTSSTTSKSQRAHQKRSHLQYLRHLHLLQCLHATQQAIDRSYRTKQQIRYQASLEILRCKERARRVRACRLLQRFIRKKLFGWEPRKDNGTEYCCECKLSQHGAVERLQFWNVWREIVCRGRLMRNNDGSSLDGLSCLKSLLEIFVRLEEDNARSEDDSHHVETSSDDNRVNKVQPSFEEIRTQMMKMETLKAAETVLDCLRPVTEVSFGRNNYATTSTTSTDDSEDSSSSIDGRTLLSLLLIAVCPTDVLGEEYNHPSEDGEETVDHSKTCARLLVKAANGLLDSLRDILKFSNQRLNFKSSLSSQSTSESSSESPPETTSKSSATTTTTTAFRNLRTSLTSASTLFHQWKQMDLESLLDSMKIQLQQSWVIYLSTSKTLRYITDLTGIDSSSSSSSQDDPLTSLRLRHEASRSGSRLHIRRIRSSLNKLVGCEEGKEIVVNAKQLALEEIDETNCLEEMRMEVDVMLRGDDNMNISGDNEDETMQRSWFEEESEPMFAMLPQALLSNVRLVHKILLTDSQDFEKLSWDGQDAHGPDVSVEEYMQMFTQQSQENHGIEVNMAMQIAKSMKLAFFNNIAMEMEQGNYDPVRGLLSKLHDKMRSLLPNRNKICILTSTMSTLLRLQRRPM